MKQGDVDAITEVERKTWDRSAAIYAASAAKLTRHALPVLIEACRLTRRSHAVDIGCGPGLVANMMAQTGASVVGVDLSPEMIKLARRSYPALTFHEANVERLPFEADTFDAALANFAMHHFARPEVGCTEIRRVLKPGGRFVFASPKAQHGFGAFIEAVQAHHTVDDLPHGPIYMDAEQTDYEKLLANSGFEEFDVQLRPFTLAIGSLEPLLAVGWTLCDLGRLPQETQDKIVASTRENAEPFKTPTGYEFPDTVFVGVAVSV